jgi:hypothetical protein
MKIEKLMIFAAGLIIASAISTGAVSSRVGAARDLGVGLAVGQPLGVTGKYWLSNAVAVDGFAGYHLNHNFDTHIDYLWHFFPNFNMPSGSLPLYAGVGGRVLLGDDSQFGVRVPLGVSYLFPTQPIECFAELAPVIQVIKEVGLDLDGQVGVRFYVNYFK